MIEVKDEILNGEPKYRLKDENGNVIYDNFSIEQITPVIQEGTPLNKVLFDSIMSYLVPSGFIGMWSGSVIPNGWYLCDGNNGTPDLRNRFIVGSGGEYAISNTGGEKTHTLTVNEMPSHNHTLSYANKNYDLASGDCLASDELGTWKYSYDRYSVTTKSTGGGQAHENRPPYYALAFIMKA